jgi:hypothetical protein
VGAEDQRGESLRALALSVASSTPRRPPGGDANSAEIRSTSTSGTGALWNGLHAFRSDSAERLAQRRPLRQAMRSIFRSVLATAVPNASEERQHDKHDDEYE